MGLFKATPKKQKYWQTPYGTSYDFYKDLLECNHLLIAGCTGSGKSVVINGILREILLTKAPSQANIILIDPKRVDYAEYHYNKIPHIRQYANEPSAMIEAVKDTVTIMENRYRQMESKRIKKYDGADLYLIIDEYADLKDVAGKEIENAVIRICQLGRAAKVHCFIATQRPTLCISTRIRANIDSRIALHTINANESKAIIEQAGAEQLPLYGQCFYRTPSAMFRYKVPMPEDNFIEHWTDESKCTVYQ